MAALLLLQGFPSSASTREFPTPRPDAVQLSYIKVSEEMCCAMEPLELIKRMREITQESYVEAEIVQLKDTKQMGAEDLSKRLKDSRSFGDAAGQKEIMWALPAQVRILPLTFLLFAYIYIFEKTKKKKKKKCNNK
ncbi:hypothetical protein PVL29_006245 [Vitis rotundifolia]|uniref:Uncharacterized protein n=1 Tax=Vitis rotundifolia TaxID=103349 RepID=A0AA39A6J8_VITRO|nr:hypothetical protein PVL29_006245 [Vitis rotundifolia]